MTARSRHVAASLPAPVELVMTTNVGLVFSLCLSLNKITQSDECSLIFCER